MLKKPYPAADLYKLIQNQAPKIQPETTHKHPLHTDLWLFISYNTHKQSRSSSTTVTAILKNDKQNMRM